MDRFLNFVAFLILNFGAFLIIVIVPSLVAIGIGAGAKWFYNEHSDVLALLGSSALGCLVFLAACIVVSLFIWAVNRIL